MAPSSTNAAKSSQLLCAAAAAALALALSSSSTPSLFFRQQQEQPAVTATTVTTPAAAAAKPARLNTYVFSAAGASFELLNDDGDATTTATTTTDNASANQLLLMRAPLAGLPEVGAVLSFGGADGVSHDLFKTRDFAAAWATLTARVDELLLLQQTEQTQQQEQQRRYARPALALHAAPALKAGGTAGPSGSNKNNNNASAVLAWARAASAGDAATELRLLARRAPASMLLALPGDEAGAAPAAAVADVLHVRAVSDDADGEATALLKLRVVAKPHIVSELDAHNEHVAAAADADSTHADSHHHFNVPEGVSSAVDAQRFLARLRKESFRPAAAVHVFAKGAVQPPPACGACSFTVGGPNRKAVTVTGACNASLFNGPYEYNSPDDASGPYCPGGYIDSKVPCPGAGCGTCCVLNDNVALCPSKPDGNNCSPDAKCVCTPLPRSGARCQDVNPAVGVGVGGGCQENACNAVLVQAGQPGGTCCPKPACNTAKFSGPRADLKP